MVHLAPTVDEASAEDIADLFLNTVFKLHGLPESIVSDRDVRFTSKFWRAFTDKLQMQRRRSSAFHPQTDGNTERVNRTLEDMLRHYIDPTQTNWDTLLPLIESPINDSHHESINAVPFVLNYGKRPKLPLDLVLHQRGEEQGKCDTGTTLAEHIQTVVARAKVCLQASQ
jgi:transposase InsO family protein